MFIIRITIKKYMKNNNVKIVSEQIEYTDGSRTFTKEQLVEAVAKECFHIDPEHLIIKEVSDGIFDIGYKSPTFTEVLKEERLSSKIPLKVEILSDDMSPLKKGDIVTLPFYNKNLQERNGWRCWKIYEGELNGKTGIIIEEKKFKGDYWKGNIFLNDDYEFDYEEEETKIIIKSKMVKTI